MVGPWISEYDRSWPLRAEHWMSLIRAATIALSGSESPQIEHIGSTSVPGLAAKPVIDLQLLVGELPPEADLIQALASIGFERARGSRPDSPGVDFDIPRPGTNPSNHLHAKQLYLHPTADVILHVRRTDSPFAAFVLAFRDWLRADPENARRYEQDKRSLARRFADADDYDDYTRAKTAFIDQAQQEIGFP